MIQTKVADRYAKALLIYSKDTNSTDIVHQDLIQIAQILNQSIEFAAFTANPIIRPNKKIEIFNEIFKGKISEITLSFLILLIKKNRESSLKLLIKCFVDQYNELNNRIHVDIISAKELTDAIKSSICEKINIWTGKEILPKFQIDSKIIGGFQVKFADYFYDASVKKQLNNLLTEFSK